MADELPVAFQKFAAKIRGTKDEIFTKLVQRLHGFEQNTMSGWRERLEDIKNPPSATAAVSVADALIPTSEETEN